MEIDNVLRSFLHKLKLKTTLSVLYGFVWIWGLIGKYLENKTHVLLLMKLILTFLVTEIQYF